MAKQQCPVHHIDLITYCPACRGEITSAKKAASSRRNGSLGGRPSVIDERRLKKLKKMREKGYTLAQIAKELGISVTTIQRATKNLEAVADR